MQKQDSVYDRTRPWQSLPERLVTDALTVAVIPGDVIALQSAPDPVVRELFPPRFGYPDTAPSIEDVINVERRYPGPINGTGSIGGYSGSTRHTVGDF